MSSTVGENVIEGLQNDDDDDSVMFMGRDISKIPCFRDTFLTSICSGLGTGILSFLATSRAPRSMHIGAGTFVLVTIGYWAQCRRRFALNKFGERQAESTFIEEIAKVKETKKSVDEQFLYTYVPKDDDRKE